MSPTGGRRPVPRGVFAIEDQQFLLPDPIALDTSFVVEALLTTQPLHTACSAFLRRIFDVSITSPSGRRRACAAGPAEGPIAASPTGGEIPPPHER
jgi:hypothetical protein